MESFEGKIAVVTGGGTGMGRELVIRLAAEGCSVATCDVVAETMAETAGAAREAAPSGVRVTTHECDVSDEAQMAAFRDAVMAEHETDHVHLVFNNAGIGGGASFLTDDREEWDTTFAVCWGGVYNGCRAFVPLLVASDEGHLVNTSSVNGFWAALGPGIPHTAYSAAKFAVKGLSEALLEDFRVHAPHVKVSVVMPGHIGTDIVLNSRRFLAGRGEDVDPGQIREQMARRGLDPDGMSDEQLGQLVENMGNMFRDNAPLSATEAAAVILDGVRAGSWRILVGDDAHAIDAAVRRDPLAAYGPDGLSLAGPLAPA